MSTEDSQPTTASAHKKPSTPVMLSAWILAAHAEPTTNPDANLGSTDSNAPPTCKELVDVAMEAWKKAVDVQQHFNDIELRIRNLALTVLGGVLSVAGLILKDAPTSLLPGFLVIGGGILSGAFYFMDRWWYHRLLHGAVEGGRKLEDFVVAHTGVPIGLANKIKEKSPVSTWFGEMRSDDKIRLFYLILVIVAVGFATGLFLSAQNSRGHGVTISESRPTGANSAAAMPRRDSSSARSSSAHAPPVLGPTTTTKK